MKKLSHNLCTLCKGSRHLCGRPVCPILLRIQSAKEISQEFGRRKEFFGSSPPGVFVGEWGYPNVNLGGLVPPVTGDFASRYDNPQLWISERVSLLDIIKYRASLLYSKTNLNVKRAPLREQKILEKLQELAMSIKPIDVEVHLKKPPVYRLNFDGVITPIGIEAPVQRLDLASNPVIPRKVDSLAQDNSIKAIEAIWILYNSSNFDVYSLMRMLSVGIFGTSTTKKIVPTRWSITAIDSMLSEKFRREILSYDLINEVLVYHNEYLGNHYEIVMIPRSLALEMIEIWLPKTIWVHGNMPDIFTVHEFSNGRVSEMDGGYYAIRFSVFEFLRKIKRQAAVLVIREIRPEYFAPVGSWQIRENVRMALRKKPQRFASLEEAINDIQRRLKTRKEFWFTKSRLLMFLKKQKRLTDFDINV
ncbi:MAG: Nre family DNA repair protein [Candidatus Asgardarchaeia archaeon]